MSLRCTHAQFTGKLHNNSSGGFAVLTLEWSCSTDHDKRWRASLQTLDESVFQVTSETSGAAALLRLIEEVPGKFGRQIREIAEEVQNGALDRQL